MALFGASAPALAGDEEALFGKKYHSDSVTKDGEPRPLVKGTRLWVRFNRTEDRTSVGWRAGCNYWGARLEVLDDLLDVKGRSLVSTDMGCPSQAHQRQDEFFARFFRKDPSWDATGDDLTLATERVTIELSRNK